MICTKMLFLTLQAVSGVPMWFQKHSLTQGDGGNFSLGYTGIFGCHPRFLRNLPESTPSFHPSIRSRYNQPAVPFRNSYGSNKHDQMTPLPQHCRGQLLVPSCSSTAAVQQQYSNVNEVFKVVDLVSMSRTAGDPSQRPFQPRLLVVISQQWLEKPRRST